MHSEIVSGDMAIAQCEGQETSTININLPARRQKGKGPNFVPSHYYKSRPSQLQIPQDMSPTSHPAPPIILPSQASPVPISSSHSRHPSISSSVNDSSSMVWEHSSLPSSTGSEPSYLARMMAPKDLSSQMFSITCAPSPSVSATYHSPSYYPGPVDDIHFAPGVCGRSNSMPMFPVQYNMPAAPGYGPVEMDSPMHHPQMEDSPLSPNAELYLAHNGHWTSGVPDSVYGADMMDARMLPRTPMSHASSIYDSEPVELSLINEPYCPNNVGMEEEVPPYAELIFMALKSAPGHQLHLQDIYQWFRDNYTKFRNDHGKGWMNSIRHNLSMNGAFVKVERPASEPGKGFMWRLAPAALEGGIKSTTRYRKKGRAVDRVAMTPDESYGCYVTPKRKRSSNQTKPQHCEPSFPEFGAVVHTPNSIDLPPMTPDFSSYHSEGFSETSVSSRNPTPALRQTEWQSPASAHRHVSPYYSQSDDGFGSSFDTPVGNYSIYGHYDGDYDCRRE